MNNTEGAAVAMEVGGRLGELTADGRSIWRPQYTRDAVVLAVLHGADCEGCAAYAGALVSAQSEFRAWDGLLVLAVPEEARREAGSAAASRDIAAGSVPTVRDEFGGAPRVIVADRFGHIFHVEEGGQVHRLPEPRELEAWLRFLATQCPE
jgi:hypothetical protein